MNKQIELITTKQSRASVPQSSRKRALSRADWLVPVGLILLTAIPALGGVLALIRFARGVALTPDDTQFRALPLPIRAPHCERPPVLPAGRLPVRPWRAPLARLSPSRRAAGGPVWPDCRSFGAVDDPVLPLLSPVPEHAALWLPHAVRLGHGPVAGSGPGRHPAAQRCPASCLDDTRLCHRSGRGHAGADCSALGADLRHRAGTVQRPADGCQ